MYATDRDSVLQIVSVGDPARPTLLGTYNTPGEARDVQVVGDRAYIVDVSNPSEPRLLSMGSPLWGGRRIVVSEGRAYLAGLLGGLQILTARRQPATRMGGAAMPHPDCRGRARCGRGDRLQRPAHLAEGERDYRQQRR